jgi:Leucine rich repeat
LKICSSTETSEKKISCEKIEDYGCQPLQKKCVMTKSTVIDSTGFSLSTPSNLMVKKISFPYNKNIEYLPANVSESFPELTTFDAAACSIKTISRETFHNLLRLEMIFLDGNLIERIDGNIFDGLFMLKEIYLSE